LGVFEVGGTGLDLHLMAVFGISRDKYSLYILRQWIVSQKNWL